MLVGGIGGLSARQLLFTCWPSACRAPVLSVLSLLTTRMATATLCSQMTAATEHGQELLLLQSQMGVMLHFRLRELQDGWTAKKIEFLSDGTVKFDNGAAHGTHSSVVNGIRVEFHCKADPLKMKYHSFDRMARTRLFMSSNKNSEWSTFITEFRSAARRTTASDAVARPSGADRRRRRCHCYGARRWQCYRARRCRCYRARRCRCYRARSFHRHQCQQLLSQTYCNWSKCSVSISWPLQPKS